MKQQVLSPRAVTNVGPHERLSLIEARHRELDTRLKELSRHAYLTPAERAATQMLDATCETPLGICARHLEGILAVAGYAGLPDGSEWVRDAVRGDPEQPAAVGAALAERLIAAGALDILARARGMV